MATKVWKGFLSFGMLSIPVYMNTGARDQKVEMHTYHTECRGQVSMPKFCVTCNKQIPKEQIFRGYDTGTGIVPITDAELEGITPETDREMQVSECVELRQIDPIYLAESFYLLPDAPGRKAYALLTKVLKDSGRVAITKVTKNGREHLAILRPKDNGLMLHYLWYSTEVNRVPEFESLNIQAANLSTNEIKAGMQLVESFTTDFDAEGYEDAYFQNLNTLIASKMDNKIAPPSPVRAAERAPTQDLMAALTASIGQRPRRQINLPEEPARAKAAGTKGSKKKRAA